MSSIDQVWESDWGLFTKLYQDTIHLLVKGTAQTRMKVIGGRTMVKTSGTSNIGRVANSLKKKKKKKKMKMKMKKLFEFSVVLCQQVWRCILAMWRVSLDREMLQKDSYVPRKS